MKKHSALLCLAIAAILTASAASAATIEDARLYAIVDGRLEYNVVYSADVAGATVTDTTGRGIISVEALAEALGVPDGPSADAHTTIVPASRTLGGTAFRGTVVTDSTGAVTSVTITSARKRPVIGISWKSATIGTDYLGFAEAFERSGAYAVFLPELPTRAAADDALLAVDGVFVTGGEDWNPSLYGETQTPHGSSWWNNERDTSDINLMRCAISRDVPMLCVCRGEQGLNVALGGKLIQDIPYFLANEVEAGRVSEERVTYELEDTGYYRWNDGVPLDLDWDLSRCTNTSPDICKPDPNTHRRVVIDGNRHSGGTGYHDIVTGLDNEPTAISESSKWLYRLLGKTEIRTIATAHHQAADPAHIGSGLTVVARASDGIVEGLEYQANTFALAVQWHPERDALRDSRDTDVDQDDCNAILGGLVDYATIMANRVFYDETKAEDSEGSPVSVKAAEAWTPDITAGDVKGLDASAEVVTISPSISITVPDADAERLSEITFTVLGGGIPRTPNTDLVVLVRPHIMGVLREKYDSFPVDYDDEAKTFKFTVTSPKDYFSTATFTLAEISTPRPSGSSSSCSAGTAALLALAAFGALSLKERG